MNGTTGGVYATWPRPGARRPSAIIGGCDREIAKSAEAPTDRHADRERIGTDEPVLATQQDGIRVEVGPAQLGVDHELLADAELGADLRRRAYRTVPLATCDQRGTIDRLVEVDRLV